MIEFSFSLKLFQSSVAIFAIMLYYLMQNGLKAQSKGIYSSMKLFSSTRYSSISHVLQALSDLLFTLDFETQKEASTI